MIGSDERAARAALYPHGEVIPMPADDTPPPVEDFATLRAERDRYRRALEDIARAESGPWGSVAQRALRGPR